MKVLALNGSPRENGNTSVLIKAALEELNAQGIETELINIGRKPVRGCMACFKCRELKNNQCAINTDDVNAIVPKMKEADGIILGSPVYYADMSGQMKSFLDRAFFVCGGSNGILKRKVGASIAAARRAGCETTLKSLNQYFLISEMMVVGSTYWNLGFGGAEGEAAKDAEGIETMRNLGKNMAWILKSIEASKNIVPQPDTAKTAHTNFIR